MSLFEQLVTLHGDWDAQRTLILGWKFGPTSTGVPVDPIGDYDPTPNSWDDVTRAANLGIITFEQLDAVQADWIAAARQ